MLGMLRNTEQSYTEIAAKNLGNDNKCRHKGEMTLHRDRLKKGQNQFS